MANADGLHFDKEKLLALAQTKLEAGELITVTSGWAGGGAFIVIRQREDFRFSGPVNGDPEAIKRSIQDATSALVEAGFKLMPKF